MTARNATARAAATRSTDLARVAVRACGRLAFTALVAFHGWLLWSHLVGGRPIDASTAARWAVSVAVLVGFRALQRHGVSVFWGKRAVILWLLVVLLHCHAVWNGDAIGVQLGIPESVTALAELAPLVTVIGLLVLIQQWHRASALRRPSWASVEIPVARVAGVPTTAHAVRFLPRPPPLR